MKKIQPYFFFLVLFFISSCGVKSSVFNDKKLSTNHKLTVEDSIGINKLLTESFSLLNNSKFDSALIKLDTAIKFITLSHIVDSLNLAKAFNWSGSAHYRLGHYEQAVSFYEKALNIRQKFLSPDHPSIADIYNNLGNLSLERHDLEIAKINYIKALKIYENANALDSTKIGMGYFSLGNVVKDQDSLQLSKKYLQKAISFFQDTNKNSLKYIGIISYVMGDVEKSMNNFKEADSCFQIAYTIFKNRAQYFYLYGVLNSMGNMAQIRGEYNIALQYLEEGLVICKKLFGESNSKAAAIYLNIASAHKGKGNYKIAEDIYLKALDLELRNKEGDEINKAKIYASLATLFELQGDQQKGIEYYLNALRIYKNKSNGSNGLVATTYKNLGIVYKNLGQVDIALDYFNKSQEIYRTIYGNDNLALADNYCNIGNTFSNVGRIDEAIDSTIKGLEVYKKLLGDNNQQVASTYIDIATNYRRKGNFTDAIEYSKRANQIFEKSLGRFHPSTAYSLGFLFETYGMNKSFETGEPLIQKTLDLLKYNPNDSLRLQKVSSIPNLIKVLLAKGNFYKNWYLQSLGADKLNIAYDAYNEGLIVLDWQRKWLQNPESKMNLSNNYFGIFEGVIESAFQLKRISDRIKYWYQAFENSEKSKALLLYESIQNSHALSYSSIPDTFLIKEKNLKIEISFLDNQRQDALSAGNSQNDTMLLTISGKLFDLKEKYSMLIKKLESNYPNYFNSKYNFSMASIPEVQKKLNEFQTLLEYFVGDSSIFFFVIKSNFFNAFERKKDFPLKDWVEQIRSNIEISGRKDTTDIAILHAQENYSILASKLYQKLVAPVEQMLTESLIIIPDGELNYLPFEALLVESPKQTNNFKSFHYLVEKHAISYTPSATLLNEMKEKKHWHEPDSNLLALAPFSDSLSISALDKLLPGIVRGESAKKLNFSGEEIGMISKLSQGRAVYNTSASTEFFKMNAPKFRILHLSQHAKANKNVGDYSYLLFSDTLLYVRDIYNLQLNSDMVVLSACETGYGELRRGEGMIGMARAFEYAGTKSLFATLWEVNDQATRDLTVNFYKRLFDKEKKMTKDQALREAKMLLIRRGGEFANPYYWAGMIGIGDMRAIKL